MTGAFLVLDMQRLLDETTVGKSAARALAQKFKTAQAEHKKLLEKVAAAKADRKEWETKAQVFEKEALSGISREQAALRAALLKRAQPHLEKLMRERGAVAVLERSAVLVGAAGTDVTREVMSAVDQEGPLTL